METHQIRLDALKKNYGTVEVINNLSADINAGEFIVILGPSGCGKSTLLNMIAGLEEVSDGQILIGDRAVQHDEPIKRGCAMVFQNYALYPHMKVADNIGYALKVARIPKLERHRRIEEVAKIVGLEKLLDRRPFELSGGQRQRVAIARAIVREPKVLLFDEPLSNLDAKLRNGMRKELALLHKRIEATSIFVTHDQVEAMTLADRIMLLNKGDIEQFSTPSELYNTPASTFVAAFIGAPSMNLFPVIGDGNVFRTLGGSDVAATQKNGHFILGIRPENIECSDTGLPIDVEYIEDLGSHQMLFSNLACGQEIKITTTFGDNPPFDTKGHIRIDPSRIHLFDPETTKRITD